MWEKKKRECVCAWRQVRERSSGERVAISVTKRSNSLPLEEERRVGMRDACLWISTRNARRLYVENEYLKLNTYITLNRVVCFCISHICKPFPAFTCWAFALCEHISSFFKHIKIALLKNYNFFLI